MFSCSSYFFPEESNGVCWFDVSNGSNDVCWFAVGSALSLSLNTSYVLSCTDSQCGYRRAVTLHSAHQSSQAEATLSFIQIRPVGI